MYYLQQSPRPKATKRRPRRDSSQWTWTWKRSEIPIIGLLQHSEALGDGTSISTKRVCLRSESIGSLRKCKSQAFTSPPTAPSNYAMQADTTTSAFAPDQTSNAPWGRYE